MLATHCGGTMGRHQVLFFAAAVRDPSDPSRLLKNFDGGDNLHLNDTGYEKMAELVAKVIQEFPAKP